jgi:hypothetical protein
LLSRGAAFGVDLDHGQRAPFLRIDDLAGRPTALFVAPLGEDEQNRASSGQQRVPLNATSGSLISTTVLKTSLSL